MANTFIYQDQTFSSGDRVKVHLNIREEGKSRVQVFEGLIIAIKGRGVNKTFTIRRIASNSIGVERILPVLSPNIKTIELVSKGKVRRSKLYYLRNRIGRRALRVKEIKDTNGESKTASKSRAKSRKSSQTATA